MNPVVVYMVPNFWECIVQVLLEDCLLDAYMPRLGWQARELVSGYAQLVEE